MVNSGSIGIPFEYVQNDPKLRILYSVLREENITDLNSEISKKFDERLVEVLYERSKNQNKDGYISCKLLLEHLLSMSKYSYLRKKYAKT